MPVLNRIAEVAPEIAEWRRDLHRHPELLFDLDRTSAVVADRLRGFGFDAVVTGLGRTGVVGVLHGRSGPGGRAVALRADMDALPIQEITGAPWASTTAGKMHACGHDGHTAMLLGAARHLAETRAFEGTVIFVFQPAEEGGGGAKAMIDDGLFDRFRIDEIYGLHNMPGLDVGRFAIRPGPIMAAADRFGIAISGRGGHAAKPQETIDPVLVGAHVVTALQSIVSRTVDPLRAAVVSVTCFNAGTTDNVIPHTANLSGTVRALDPTVRQTVEAKLHHVVRTTAEVFGAEATVTYRRGYPVTVNDPAAAAFAADVARRIVGDGAVAEDADPMMGAEDFSYYLERKPGAFIFMGNGPSAGLHHPAYDFDDTAIAYGTSWWVTLAEAALARGG
ncbi:M20 aminoacylase family protein [Oharaeibacter diazotrophicus]|uniref:Hippurate hydrolase n=1 Tax=Oharaeibacter diazotrophicus TaxID=1920512 RepID=A0A4R6RD75_9HYPH|nr:M20 aminoacylase family protein [Oharaeibacter diazotrophicus]TDP84130.1 hippurate hydrolase [Oharaeibacter diazotrophicus]BBE73169.1 putative hydrolase YxeP [Pleomorphomonas sp. SM30]GLS74958.1 hippurate hydrolase [Oharaeibacter diazotrophicus]